MRVWIPHCCDIEVCKDFVVTLEYYMIFFRRLYEGYMRTEKRRKKSKNDQGKVYTVCCQAEFNEDV